MYFRLVAFAPTCTGLDFLSKERRHIMELAIGIVVVGIILLLGRLADWFEEKVVPPLARVLSPGWRSDVRAVRHRQCRSLAARADPTTWSIAWHG
jgi:hypothetical protein